MYLPNCNSVKCATLYGRLNKQQTNKQTTNNKQPNKQTNKQTDKQTP